MDVCIGRSVNRWWVEEMERGEWGREEKWKKRGKKKGGRQACRIWKPRFLEGPFRGGLSPCAGFLALLFSQPARSFHQLQLGPVLYCSLLRIQLLWAVCDLFFPLWFPPCVPMLTQSVLLKYILILLLRNHDWLPHSLENILAKTCHSLGTVCSGAHAKLLSASFTSDRLVPCLRPNSVSFSPPHAAEPQGHLISPSPVARWGLRAWSP